MFILLLIICSSIYVNGQEHQISIDAQLDDKENILQIKQRIIFSNDSDATLTEIYLHNWANGYKNNKAPLSKRLIEDYDKSLYFANEKDRGFTSINNLTVNFETVSFLELENNQIDVIKIQLNKSIKPKESVEAV